MGRSPAANDADDDLLENQIDGVTQPLSEFVESPKGFQEEEVSPAELVEQTNFVPSLQTQLPDDPRIQALARWESVSKKKPWSKPVILSDEFS